MNSNIVSNPVWVDAPGFPPAKQVVFANAQQLGSIHSKLLVHTQNKDIHVTTEDKEKWNSKVDQTTIDEIRAELANKADKSDIPSTEDITVKYDFVTEDRLKNELSDYVTEDTLSCKIKTINGVSLIGTGNVQTNDSIKLDATQRVDDNYWQIPVKTDEYGNLIGMADMSYVWNYIAPLITQYMEVVDGVIQLKPNVPREYDPTNSGWDD